MNPAFAPFETLPGFRARGDDQFQASCPTSAHPHGDRSRGLSGRIFGTKVVLKCFAGCSTEDILAAMGLDWRALFANGGRHPRQQPDPATDLRHRAEQGLRAWRDAELTHLAIELRTRDGFIRAISTAVSHGMMTEDVALGSLGPFHQNYSVIESRFETLRTGTNHEWLELWRQRGGAHAA